MFHSWISSSEHVLSPAHTNPVVLYWVLQLGQEGNGRPTPSHWHLWEKTQGLVSLTINLDKPIVPQCWWFHEEGLLLVHVKWACTGCVFACHWEVGLLTMMGSSRERKCSSESSGFKRKTNLRTKPSSTGLCLLAGGTGISGSSSEPSAPLEEPAGEKGGGGNWMAWSMVLSQQELKQKVHQRFPLLQNIVLNINEERRLP